MIKAEIIESYRHCTVSSHKKRGDLHPLASLTLRTWDIGGGTPAVTFRTWDMGGETPAENHLVHI